MHHSQAFMTRSPRISGFQSSQVVSKPSAKRMQKFLKCPLLTSDSEEQAVISVLSMVRTSAEPVSNSMVWLAWRRTKAKFMWPQVKQQEWEKSKQLFVKVSSGLVTCHSVPLWGSYQLNQIIWNHEVVLLIKKLCSCKLIRWWMKWQLKLLLVKWAYEWNVTKCFCLLHWS